MRERLWLALRPWQRHSLVVVMAGFVYMAIGAVYFFVPLNPERALGLRVALDIAPMQAWGLVWAFVGFLALVSARWPPQSKTWGYAALSGLAALWAAIYGLGVVMLDTPRVGLSAAFVWFLVSFLWWAISGLVNPDDIVAEE
jgi:hypothetical protein